MNKEPLSPKQVMFLTFSVTKPLYNGDKPNPTLPVKGAAAKSIADSLVRRGYVAETGFITPLGHEALAALSLPPAA